MKLKLVFLLSLCAVSFAWAMDYEVKRQRFDTLRDQLWRIGEYGAPEKKQPILDEIGNILKEVGKENIDKVVVDPGSSLGILGEWDNLAKGYRGKDYKKAVKAMEDAKEIAPILNMTSLVRNMWMQRANETLKMDKLLAGAGEGEPAGGGEGEKVADFAATKKQIDDFYNQYFNTPLKKEAYPEFVRIGEIFRKVPPQDLDKIMMEAIRSLYAYNYLSFISLFDELAMKKQILKELQALKSILNLSGVYKRQFDENIKVMSDMWGLEEESKEGAEGEAAKGEKVVDFEALKLQMDSARKKLRDAYNNGKGNPPAMQAALDIVKGILQQVKPSDVNNLIPEVDKRSVLVNWIKLGEFYIKNKEYDNAEIVLQDGRSRAVSWEFESKTVKSDLLNWFDETLRNLKEAQKPKAPPLAPAELARANRLREDAEKLQLQGFRTQIPSYYSDIPEIFKNDDDAKYGFDKIREAYQSLIFPYHEQLQNEKNLVNLNKFLGKVKEYRPQAQAIIDKFQGQDLSGITFKGYDARESFARLVDFVKNLDDRQAEYTKGFEEFKAKFDPTAKNFSTNNMADLEKSLTAFETLVSTLGDIEKNGYIFEYVRPYLEAKIRLMDHYLSDRNSAAVENVISSLSGKIIDFYASKAWPEFQEQLDRRYDASEQLKREPKKEEPKPVDDNALRDALQNLANALGDVQQRLA